MPFSRILTKKTDPSIALRSFGSIGNETRCRSTSLNRRLVGLLGAVLLASATSGVSAKGTGYLFVSSEKDHNITVLDGQSYDVIKKIATAERPRHLQFNADKTLLYAACGDGNAIEVIDVDKLELVDRIVGIDDPEAFDFSPDGKTMYITLEDDGKLGILDLETYFAERGETPELTVAEVMASDDANREDDDDEEDSEGAGDSESVPGMSTIEVGLEPEGILVSPDGHTVYVTSEVANMVHVVDTQSHSLSANVLVGNRPRRFALTPDLGELWVSNELSGSVTILDPATNKVIESIEFVPPGFRPEDVTPVGITMTADGKTAIVGLGRANHVAFVDVASREIENYVLVGNRAWNVELTADNARAYVTNGLSDDISVIDLAKRRVVKSIPTGRVPYAVVIDD